MFKKYGVSPATLALIGGLTAGVVAAASGNAAAATADSLSNVQNDLLFLGQVDAQRDFISDGNLTNSTENLCIEFTSAQVLSQTYYDGAIISDALDDTAGCTAGFVGSTAAAKVYVHGAGFKITILNGTPARVSELISEANGVSDVLALTAGDIDVDGDNDDLTIIMDPNA